MSLLRIHKTGLDHVVFDSVRLYAWSTYDVEICAPEFAEDTSSEAKLRLLHSYAETADVVFAECSLVADPLRRGIRRGRLAIGDRSRAALFDSISHGSAEGFVLYVTVGSDNTTVVYREVPVVMTPKVVQSGGGSGSSSAGLWTVVDRGSVTAPLSIPVDDMTQVVVNVSGAGRINVLPSVSGVPVASGPFEAYVRFVTPGGWAPLTDVVVNGAGVTWDYRDSASLGSTEWLLHLMSVGGVWRASLKSDASVPGVEEDSDGDAVPGTEVNE